MKNIRVKLHTILAGPTLSGQPGQVITVPEDQAKELIAGKFASAVGEPGVETAAAAPAPETASRKRGGGKGAKAAAAAPAPEAPAAEPDSQLPGV